MRYLTAIISLFLITHSYPAHACSEIDAPFLTYDEITRVAKTKIKQSDVILDAVVVRRQNGSVILQPIRVWKGVRRSSYYISNAGCGVALSAGTRVRVLLQKLDWDWMVIEPVIGRAANTRRRFDEVLDSHLGNTRPTSYQSVAPLVPPAP